MAELFSVQFRKAPANLASDLRKMADAVDAGQVTSLVACFIEDDNVCYMWASSLWDSVTMATLLQSQAMAKLRGGA